jgi:hypothetical protein
MMSINILVNLLRIIWDDWQVFLMFLFGVAVGGYAMFASGFIVLSNIIEPSPDIKTYQFRSICEQLEQRDCETKYIRAYILNKGDNDGD